MDQIIKWTHHSSPNTPSSEKETRYYRINIYNKIQFNVIDYKCNIYI